MTKKKDQPKQKPTISDEEFLKVLDKISKKLVYKFKFGYHEIEDMKQQAAIFALEGLEKYDHKRPLENFLWTHVRNRLFNYKRNNYQRPDKPCLSCPLYDPECKVSTSQCSKYSDKESCELYKSWFDRNNSKKNIMKPSYIDYDISNNSELIDSISNVEIIKFLDQNIHSDYRETYLRLKHGEKIPKQKLVKLQTHIKNLLKTFNKSV
jgi:hypothetical protein